MISVILHEPDMPQNTGNIVRLCANAGAALHLIEPLGFAWDDKRLRRAHLDYEEFAEVQRHASWEICKVAFATKASRIFAIETGGDATPYETEFQLGDALLFGSESRGLPEDILAEVTVLTLPMMPGSRSLNLSNAVAITVYEAWRQLAFAAATPLGTPPRERSFAFFNGNPNQLIPPPGGG